jgi:hypothetical protein
MRNLALVLSQTVCAYLAVWRVSAPVVCHEPDLGYLAVNALGVQLPDYRFICVTHLGLPA